jgi:hypothetical protein
MIYVLVRLACLAFFNRTYVNIAHAIVNSDDREKKNNNIRNIICL